MNSGSSGLGGKTMSRKDGGPLMKICNVLSSLYVRCSLLLFLFLFSGTSEAIVQEAHKVCTSCHIEKGPPALKYGINETCIKCHTPTPGRDHPYGIVQSEVPDKLPLDKESRITCITCHEPHGKETSGRLLRLEFDKLCAVCHKN